MMIKTGLWSNSGRLGQSMKMIIVMMVINHRGARSSVENGSEKTPLREARQGKNDFVEKALRGENC